jgi:hypothetical protein
MTADRKPNLTFTYWLEALEEKLGRELDGEDYLFATKMYDQHVPWRTVALMLEEV